MEIGNQNRHMLMILLILFLAFMSSMTSVAIAQETSYSIDETRITTDGKAILPDIYADKIAYIVYHDSGYLGDIYLYDLSTQHEIQVDVGTITRASLDICGGKIVWSSDNTEGHDIYMYDLSTSQITQITNDGKSGYPRIYGNIIVYEVEYQSTSTYSDIYMYDISTSQKTQLTSGTVAISPHIYGDKIVWCQNYDIYMYDISTGQEPIQITSGGKVSGMDIYGDKIVWTSDQNVIHLYDLSTSNDVTIASTNYSNVPAIYKDRVVWSDYHDSHGSDDIFMYNISTGQKTQITTNGHSRDPNIFGNRIVYRNYGGTVGFGTDVYMATVSKANPLIIETTFSPKPNGYNFDNRAGEEYSFDEFKNVYLLNKYNGLYNTWFYNNYFKKLNGGYCFGFSSSCLVLYNQGIDNIYYDYFESDETPIEWDNFGSFVNGFYPLTLIDLTRYYQPLQCDKAILQDQSTYKGLPVIYAELKNRMSSSDWTQNPMVLAYSCKVFDENTQKLEKAGHAIVPYKIIENTDHRTADIYVYDSNHNGNSNKYLHVDLEKWEVSDYDGFMQDLTDFRLVSLKAITEKPEIPSGLDLIKNNFQSHLLYTDSSGRHLGYDQGTFKDEIPGTCPIVFYEDKTNDNSISESYYVPDLIMKKELCGIDYGISNVTMMTPNGLIIADVAVSPGSIDEIKILENGLGTEFKSGSGTSSLNLTVDVETIDYAQIVRANISQLEVSDVIDLSNNDGIIEIQNQGKLKTFDLYIEQLSNNANEGNIIKDVVLEEDSTLFIKPSNWDDIANTDVIIEHDLGSDGTIDSTETIRPENNPVSPIANAGDDKTANEGKLVTFSGSYTDAGTVDAHTFEWDFGDGSTESGTLTPTHTYADNGEYTVTLTVTDDDGGVGTDTLTMTVNNVNPVIDTITLPIDPCKVNTPVAVSSTFTDVGILDTHTAVWDWGDGTTSAGIVTEINGAGTVTGEHTYTNAGIYRVALTVTDDDGGIASKTSESYVVVYDSTGGFVTGGGWINSPAGAVPDTTLAGKATFSLESKYRKGATVPTDNTNFQFKIGNLNFKSTSCDWLVISGTQAIYQGSGTINGAGNYGFMLSAVDGAIKGDSTDKFRIKIWDKASGAIVYDNQMDSPDDADPTTAIGGGSIAIHKAK